LLRLANNLLRKRTERLLTDGPTAQLQDTATVDRFSFRSLSRSDGKPVKDLNDLLKIGSDSYRRNAAAVNNVMRFY
jgi:hypothetical protein